MSSFCALAGNITVEFFPLTKPTCLEYRVGSLKLNISCVAKIVDLKRSFGSKAIGYFIQQLKYFRKGNEIFCRVARLIIYTHHFVREIQWFEIFISYKFEFRNNWTFFICDGRLFARGSVCIFLAENFKVS